MPSQRVDYKEMARAITDRVVARQDRNGCWNVLQPGEPRYPEFNYYVPNYKSTLWTLILLAEVETPVEDGRFLKPLSIITDRFFDERAGIFTIGKSHFPIPCLNGNMLYLHGYFQSGRHDLIDRVVDFFAEYQRFDDGDFRTPSAYPYGSNRSCYGRHTCYWGVVKLLKGLSFIPKARRSRKATDLLRRCTEFVRRHRVCFRSHAEQEYLHPHIQFLTFPNMYRADFLELLWLLKRERVRGVELERALDLLESKQQAGGQWKLERRIQELIVPIGARTCGNEWVTKRAREVLAFYRPGALR